jgi:hypothetical protein
VYLSGNPFSSLSRPSSVVGVVSQDEDINEIGKQLQQILLDNRKGLEAAMRTVYTQATIKTISWGGAFRNDQFVHMAINPAGMPILSSAL